MKNILILICDQLSAKALKAYGNTDSKTPAMDVLADSGVVFDRAYSPCPLCQPARAAFWSSSYPHQNGVISNLPKQKQPAFPAEITTLGEVFQKGGYECMHFGKEHDYGALRGFTKVANEQKKAEAEYPDLPYDYETYFDIDTTEKAVRYLQQTVPTLDKPLLMAVDLQNPHNICAYIGAHAQGGAGHVPADELPRLPENFRDSDKATRASFFQYLCCGHRRQSQTADWSERDFQHYLHAYYYYLQKVDRQIGEVLAALKQSGKAEDTLIVLMADHGEGMAAHQIVTKSGTFYEETVRVPFVLAGQALGRQPRRYDRLFSLLDILPTLADYAGLPVPASATGVSHWPALRAELKLGQSDRKAEEIDHGQSLAKKDQPVSSSDRQAEEKAAAGSPAGDDKLTAETDERAYPTESYVVSQWHDEFAGYFVPARMYLTESYKYLAYQDKNGLEEELYDMTADRLEQQNLAALPEYSSLLERYRQSLQAYCAASGDPFFQLKADYADKYRRHPVGRHSGPNAVLDYQARINQAKQAGKA